MTNSTSNPRANRFPMPLQVYCSFELIEGFASLADISYTGALLGNTGMRPKIGTRVTLCMHLKPPRASEAVAPSELIGVASRHSSDGFAVKFESGNDPDVRRMVDDAFAVVATRSLGSAPMDKLNRPGSRPTP